MSTQIGGMPAIAEANLPAAVNIASTTNATPIVITTSTPHGLNTGDYFIVQGADEPALNGAHLMAGTITSTTIGALVAPAGTNTVGTLAGGAAGTLLPQTFGLTLPIPSDGVDNWDAASVNVAFEALADRTAYLIYALAAIFLSDNEWAGAQTFDGPVVVGDELGVQLTGAQPTATSDPGADNISISLNQSKAWCNVSVGGGTTTINDGMNVASVGISVNEIIVTFARPMANTNYSVTFGVENSAADLAQPMMNATKTTGGFHFNIWNPTTGLVISPATASSRKIAFDVKARQ